MPSNEFGKNRWIALGKSLDQIKVQLDQAKADVESLESLKGEALADPQGFLVKLKENVGKLLVFHL